MESDEGTYKIVFENESGSYKDILSPGNGWLAPNAYLRIFGKKFIKNMGFDVDKPKSGTQSKIPRKRMEQIKQYVDEINDNTKQFTKDLMNYQQMKTIKIILCFKISSLKMK